MSGMQVAHYFSHLTKTRQESRWINHIANSKLRQVPDNQEVWIDKDGFTSIIFDITERVGPSGSGPEVDGRAMTTHLEDMIGTDIDTVKIWNTAETEFSCLEYVLRICFRSNIHLSVTS